MTMADLITLKASFAGGHFRREILDLTVDEIKANHDKIDELDGKIDDLEARIEVLEG